MHQRPIIVEKIQFISKHSGEQKTFIIATQMDIILEWIGNSVTYLKQIGKPHTANLRLLRAFQCKNDNPFDEDEAVLYERLIQWLNQNEQLLREAGNEIGDYIVIYEDAI